MMRVQRLLDALSALQRRHALLLFVALGGLLFAVDGLRPRQQSLPGLPAGLASPQAANQWLEDEVLYREAVALSDPHPGGTHIEALSAVELDRQFGKALAPQLGARERAQRDWLLDQRELQTQRALDRLKARYGIAMGGRP